MSRHHDQKASGRPYRRLRRRILDRDGWRCTKCGKAGILEVHHVVPLEDGGTNDPRNLSVLCRSCHIEHHRNPDSLPDDWRDRVEAELKS